MLLYTRSDIAKVEYDVEKGYYLEDFYFDELIKGNQTYLSVEQSILLDNELCITWTLSAGWIIIPLKNMIPDYVHFIPLAQYLTYLTGKEFHIENELSQREEMIQSYIDTLEERIRVIKVFNEEPNAIQPDELTFILKEHRHPAIKSLHDLLLFLEKELRCWYATRHKLLEYGEFDCSNTLLLKASI